SRRLAVRVPDAPAVVLGVLRRLERKAMGIPNTTAIGLFGRRRGRGRGRRAAPRSGQGPRTREVPEPTGPPGGGPGKWPGGRGRAGGRFCRSSNFPCGETRPRGSTPRASSLPTRKDEHGAGGGVDAEPSRTMQAAFSRPEGPAEPSPGLRRRPIHWDSTATTIVRPEGPREPAPPPVASL